MSFTKRAELVNISQGGKSLSSRIRIAGSLNMRAAFLSEESSPKTAEKAFFATRRCTFLRYSWQGERRSCLGMLLRLFTLDINAELAAIRAIQIVVEKLFSAIYAKHV